MNSTKIYLPLRWALTFLLSLSICLNTSLAQEPIPEGAVVVMEKDLIEAGRWMQNCKDFSVTCQRRVGLLESYKAEADKLIEHQELKNVQIEDELRAEKRKNNILLPFLGVAAGFLGGALLIHK